VHVDSWNETYAGILPQAHLDDLGYRARESIWKAIDPERTHDPVYRGELYAIYILRASQGRGLGRQLVRVFTEALHQLGYDAMLL
jgi:ribosomal protein S18 acetylase RimI-like enzyme